MTEHSNTANYANTNHQEVQFRHHLRWRESSSSSSSSLCCDEERRCLCFSDKCRLLGAVSLSVFSGRASKVLPKRLREARAGCESRFGRNRLDGLVRIQQQSTDVGHADATNFLGWTAIELFAKSSFEPSSGNRKLAQQISHGVWVLVE